MFPDSKHSVISCGRTKAQYICNFAIGPFVKSEITAELSQKMFSIHLDESVYHKKIRVEFWVCYFGDDHTRKFRYLSTEELETKFDTEQFLRSDSSALKIENLGVVTAQAMFEVCQRVLEDFSLDPTKLAYVMTDNCNSMRGNRSGLVSKLNDVCPNMIDTTGCCSHLSNLLQKYTSIYEHIVH